MGNRLASLMKTVLFVGLSVAGGFCAAAPEAVKEPVLVFLYARITDHINVDLSEDRLRHLLPALEKYRSQFPSAHVTATVMFSGAASEALAERNEKTHIVDFVKDYIKRGIVEPGYDGENEPTYKNRPTLDFSNAKSLDDRWTVRAETAEKILTEARNPLTGGPEAGKDGGLKRMQQVFGEAAYIAGVEPMLDKSPHPSSRGSLTPATDVTSRAHVAPDPNIKHPRPTFIPETGGGDAETVREIQRYNTRAIMVGLPEDNPAAIAGFGGSEEGFAKLLSPIPESSPEVYWQDNVLRLSEVSNTSEEAEEAESGFHGLNADEIKKDFGELNRSRIQVVRVELADERYYLQRAVAKDDEYALKYAYDHPVSPQLPAEAKLSVADVDAAYTKEAEAMKWVAGEFLWQIPGAVSWQAAN